MVDPEGYIDINVFVYWLGDHPTLGKKAYEWIKKIEKDSGEKYVTSTLAVYQTVLIIAGLTGKKLRDKELIKKIVNSMESLPGLTVAPLTAEDMTWAAELMEEHNIDYEDAIHLASALKNKAKKMISNDRDFDKTPLKRRFE